MKKSFTLLLLATIIAGCNTFAQNNNTMNDKEKKSEQVKNAVSDTTPRVTGIGGIFFKSKDPKAAMEWYGKNLGMNINDYGSTFEVRNAARPEETDYLQWTPFAQGTDYFEPSKKEFMINYRVQNLEGLVKKLKANGVTIVDKIETYDYGKFIHIMDADGNKIELWEPVEHDLTHMKGKTAK
jgi:predicted enzyme related to lactoylglutathione lyase